MKLSFAEYPPNSEKYEYPYQVFATIDPENEIDVALDQGFLPTRFHKKIFMLGRSGRVNLAIFALSSENRRILRKTQQFHVEVLDLDHFDYTNEVQLNCKTWLNSRIGQKVISAQGVKKAFKLLNNNIVFVWYKGDEVVGYVVGIGTDNVFYYNWAFYNPVYVRENLGVRMMLEAVQYAQTSKMSYIYLGTVYTKGSLYKTQYKGFEFFDGIRWNKNLKDLKFLIRRSNVAESYYWQDEQWRVQNGFERVKDIIESIATSSA